MRVIWTPEAEQDRADFKDNIGDYIAPDNVRAAAQMDALFSDAVTRLASYPMLGHTGKVLGTFELIPHESYRIVYEIASETVWVPALVHTARLWPPLRE